MNGRVKTYRLPHTELDASAVILGLMRIPSLTDSEIRTLVGAARDAGINVFDHADIYGRHRHECEERFGAALALTPDEREQLVIQSKVGIRQGYFDFSAEHILDTVEESLTALRTDYLDVLLLHRPDALVEPEEVAEAFDQLQSSGKVRHFGVSNQHPRQIELLRRHVKQPIVANQLQFGIMHTGMIDQGIHVNMLDEGAVDRDGGILDYCRLHDITIQAWSPFQHGFFSGVFIDNPDFPELNEALSQVAQAHGVSSTTIAVAWILRHPAKIQVVTGTTRPERLLESKAAFDVQLTRDEWYKIYLAAGNILP